MALDLRHAASRLAAPLVVLTTLVTAAAALGQVVAARPIAVGGGCGYDGVVYCAMEQGARGVAPFGRRVLAPWLAHFLGPDAVADFRVLNLVACVALTAVAALLVVEAATPGRRRAAVLPALAVVSVCLAARDLLHFVVDYPAVTDPVALLCLLLGGLALVRVSSAPSGWTALLLVAAAVAPLARETFGLPLAAGAVVALALGRVRWWTAALAVAAAAAGTVTAFAAAAPAPDGSASVLRVMAGWVSSDLGSASGLLRFSVMLAIAVVLPALPLLSRRARGLLGDRERVLVAVAATLLVVSVFGGGDTDRILTPVGVVLAVVLARVVVGRPELLAPLGLLVLAQVVAQAPLTVVGSSARSWGSYFDLRLTPVHEVLVNGVLPVALAAVPLLAAVLLWRAEPRAAAPGSAAGVTPAAAPGAGTGGSAPRAGR